MFGDEKLRVDWSLWKGRIAAQMALPWPDCGKCKRRVEHMEINHDISTMAWQVTVRCHGDQETTKLEGHWIEDCRAILPGIAFAKVPQLSEGARDGQEEDQDDMGR